MNRKLKEVFTFSSQKRKIFVKYKDRSHPTCIKANKKASEVIQKAHRDFEKSHPLTLSDKKMVFACQK